MKNKLLVFLLIWIFLFSAFNVVLATVQCPRCRGTGEIPTQTCPTCGGSGVLEPMISRNKISAGASGSTAVFVEGAFQNQEYVGVYGIATAQVKTSSYTYTATSSRTYFPPQEEITVNLIVEGVKYEIYWSYLIQISEVEPVTCPECGGTGGGSATIVCPDCGGTGFIASSEGATNFLDIGGVVGGVAVVAVVAVAAVVIVKRKRVTEKDLKKLPLSEFQNWVIKRLAGKPSSPRDAQMGIDGFTIEGQPIAIKQSDGVGRNVIENFAAAMGRSKANKGIIVAFSFGSDAYTGIVRAKLNYRIEIKMTTVNELIESRKTILL